MATIGQRKFTATAGATILMLGLSFLGLLLGKLTGSEFISAVNVSGLLVGGFCGINIAGHIFGKDGTE